MTKLYTGSFSQLAASAIIGEVPVEQSKSSVNNQLPPPPSDDARDPTTGAVPLPDSSIGLLGMYNVKEP